MHGSGDYWLFFWKLFPSFVQARSLSAVPKPIIEGHLVLSYSGQSAGGYFQTLTLSDMNLMMFGLLWPDVRDTLELFTVQVFFQLNAQYYL